MTPFPDISFINKERMGAINESAVRTIIAPKNPLPVFLFHALLFQLDRQLTGLNLLATLRF